MMMFTKILLVWKRYICTGYGISEMYYGGVGSKLSGTGQGNKFSGELCRDTSCLIIKQIENQNLGIMFESNAINVIE